MGICGLFRTSMPLTALEERDRSEVEVRSRSEVGVRSECGQIFESRRGTCRTTSRTTSRPSRYARRYWTLRLIKNGLLVRPQFRRTHCAGYFRSTDEIDNVIRAGYYDQWRRSVRFRRGNRSVSGEARVPPAASFRRVSVCVPAPSPPPSHTHSLSRPLSQR